jgi:hypothetical protein
MAIATIRFDNAAVIFVNHDWFMKILRCECQRMEKPIATFTVPFAKKVMRCVAIVALGNVLMSRFDPGVIVPLHDVTVRAGFTFGRKIRGALGIVKRKRSASKRSARQDRRQDCCDGRSNGSFPQSRFVLRGRTFSNHAAVSKKFVSTPAISFDFKGSGRNCKLDRSVQFRIIRLAICRCIARWMLHDDAWTAGVFRSVSWRAIKKHRALGTALSKCGKICEHSPRVWQ